MSFPISNSSSVEINQSPVDQDVADNSPNYKKAAFYILVATVAAVIFAALLVSGGGSIVVAGFMFSIGLSIDGVGILAGTAAIALFASFFGYLTSRYSMKANKIFNPPTSTALPATI